MFEIREFMDFYIGYRCDFGNVEKITEQLQAPNSSATAAESVKKAAVL